LDKALNFIECNVIDNIRIEAADWSLNNETALGGGYFAGCADAARHAYATALASYSLGPEATKDFADAHEASNFIGCNDNNMDIANNYVGINLGLDSGCVTNICFQNVVVDSLKNGDLVYLDASGRLVSSNTCSVTY
jgi:hypothetical protein